MTPVERALQKEFWSVEDVATAIREAEQRGAERMQVACANLCTNPFVHKRVKERA